MTGDELTMELSSLTVLAELVTREVFEASGR
jgi:hypothetical protein